MISEMYDALLTAGVPEERARKAAEAVASNDQRVSKVEQDLTVKTGDLRSEIVSFRSEFTAYKAETAASFASVGAELTLIKWMGGIIVTGVAALIARTFFG